METSISFFCTTFEASRISISRGWPFVERWTMTPSAMSRESAGFPSRSRMVRTSASGEYLILIDPPSRVIADGDHVEFHVVVPSSLRGRDSGLPHLRSESPRLSQQDKLSFACHSRQLRRYRVTALPRLARPTKKMSKAEITRFSSPQTRSPLGNPPRGLRRFGPYLSADSTDSRGFLTALGSQLYRRPVRFLPAAFPTGFLAAFFAVFAGAAASLNSPSMSSRNLS